MKHFLILKDREKKYSAFIHFSMMEKSRQELIDVVPYREDLRDVWEDFIENKAINSTFLHSRKFFDHNPLNATDDASLLYYKNGAVVAVFPACVYSKNNKLIFHSHLRATYGGFVVSKKVGVEEALQIVEQTIQFAKEKKAEQIIVRNPFRIFHAALCDETDYAMWYYGFQIKSRELETAVSLSGNIDEVKAQYKEDAKRNVKKALKCVEIKPIEDLEKYWDLLEKCHQERHGVKPVHNYEDICRLIENVGKDRVLSFGAYSENRLIAGCLVFVANRNVLHGQYIAADMEFRHLKPIHALMNRVIEYGCENGFLFLNFGTSNENDGRGINYGLFSIKEHFGGRALLRETMILDV